MRRLSQVRVVRCHASTQTPARKTSPTPAMAAIRPHPTLGDCPSSPPGDDGQARRPIDGLPAGIKQERVESYLSRG